MSELNIGAYEGDDSKEVDSLYDTLVELDRRSITPASAEEISLAVTIADYTYPVGNVMRYGADPTYVTTTNESDSTQAFQDAADVLLAGKGGELFIPAGHYGISSVDITYSSGNNIRFRGASTTGVRLYKLSGTSTPVINAGSVAAGLITIDSSFSDFSIWGLNDAHVGLSITLLARFEVNRVAIFNCSTAIENVGSLVFSMRGCTITSNIIGYRSRKVSNTYANDIAFYNCVLSSNTTYGLDLGDSSGASFYACDFERNGTTVNLSTGAVVIRDTADDEFTIGNIAFYDCWFESNLGMTFKAEAATGLRLEVNNTKLIGCESGNVMDIGAIAALSLNGVNAGDTNDTITTAAVTSSVRNCYIYTYTDNSTVSSIVQGLADVNGNTHLQTTNFEADFTNTSSLYIPSADITTATRTLSALDSGKTLYLKVGTGCVVTLPAVVAGLKFTLIKFTSLSASNTYTLVTPGGVNILFGFIQQPNGASPSLAKFTNIVAQDTITFNTISAFGDRVDIECDGANWHFKTLSGVDGGITTSVA
ncbi:MAG: hypothetical protein ACQ9ET_04970, partial [Nitrosomonadaceae bacterium]